MAASVRWHTDGEGQRGGSPPRRGRDRPRRPAAVPARRRDRRPRGRRGRRLLRPRPRGAGRRCRGRLGAARGPPRHRQAIADAVEREGAAEAAAILARGQAEAEALDARSEAFAEYGEAAVLEMLVKVLPEVVQAAAAPLAGVDKMTVISADGAGSLGRSVAANVAQGLQLSGDLTGVDVAALLRRLGGAGAVAGTATADGAATRVPVVPADGEPPAR
ncbi:flotillin domain-containing protein [Geodermatophilus sp. SYSU D01105]